MAINTQTIEEPEVKRLLLTIGECEKVLGLSRTIIVRLCNAGELASIKIGGTRRIPTWAAESFIVKKLVEAGFNDGNHAA